MNTSAGYQRMLRIVEGIARNVLTQNKEVLVAALHALLQALKEEPKAQLQLLIYGSSSYPIYEPGYGSRPQNYLQMRQALLLESAETMFVSLLGRIINQSMSTTLNVRY